MNAAKVAAETKTILELYACTGIFCEIDSFEIDPPASCITWNTRFPNSALSGDPSVEDFTSSPFGPSPSETDIINVVRARPDFSANDLYLVFVQHLFSNPLPAANAQLTIANFGISFPDIFVAANSIGKASASSASPMPPNM